ncbi:MAG: ribose-5-phosphate isomerase rki1 [Geoglossum umbratile]|nr:MAG: ribose-5-phosphate isomerase rki1 [Geoglossum umbratile]
MDAIQALRNPPPPSLPLTPLNAAKRTAAYHAVSHHLPPNATYVGIGSGSTIVFAVEAIASLPRSVTFGMTFIPTGHQSRQLIIDAALRLGAIDSLPKREDGVLVMLDVAFDGADEVDEELNLVKGGGACLFQEKLVAVSARKFICVADHSKLSPKLLTTYPTIPIEVVPPSAPAVLQQLRVLGSPSPFLRPGGSAKAGPIVTDNSNFIIDAPFPPLLPSAQQNPDPNNNGQWDVATLAKHIKDIVGVVEVGLFWGRYSANGVGGQKPIAAYFGKEDGEVLVKTQTLEKTP